MFAKPPPPAPAPAPAPPPAPAPAPAPGPEEPEPKLYKKRTWSNIYEFLFSCMSMSVGLGNFWRFPYICYESGGGAFLIPYCLVLVTVGRPMYYLDLAMGQFSGKGNCKMYLNLAPGWLGIGIVQCICNYFVMSYYAFLLAIAILYLVNSFTYELPWTKCRPQWGNSCVSIDSNITNAKNAVSSAEMYLFKEMLKQAENIDHGLGYPDWKLMVSLLFIWICAFFYLIWGIKSSGKVAYFTGLFPYLVMIILLIRSSTLPGAVDGVIFFLKPEFKKLLNTKVWLNAVTQCFFSLGIGFGTVAMYASYNDIHCDINTIGLIIAVVDTLTSLLSGLTIFSALGNLSYRLGTTVDKVVQDDAMVLGFVSYPDAIGRFETVPYVFAVVFFFMFFTLGIGSLASFQQVLTTNLLEVYPKFREWHVAMLTSLLGFVSGIIYTTPGGIAISKLVDLFGVVYIQSVLALAQIIAICYVYGLRVWCWDVEYMSNKKVIFYWRWTWAVTCPIVMIIIYINSVFMEHGLQYRKRDLPLPAQISAYMLLILASSPFLICILYFIIKFRREKLTCKESIKETFNSKNWLPADSPDRELIIPHREQKYENYPHKEKNPTQQYFLSLVQQKY